jgi:hypothetical protein
MVYGKSLMFTVVQKDTPAGAGSLVPPFYFSLKGLNKGASFETLYAIYHINPS